MAQAKTRSSATEQRLPREQLLEFLAEMLLIRRFEEKVEERFRAGELAGFLHVCIGQEAVAVGVCRALEDGDVMGSTHRAHGHVLAHGTPPNEVMAELYGKVEGCSHGYGGSMHLYDVARGTMGANAVVGGGLPAAVGACVASGRPVICLAGDGSIQMNLQELQTIVHHQLPIKIFVFSNRGYLSMRQTQDNLFGGRHVGEGPESGVSLPDMLAVAGAFGIPARRISRHDELAEAIATTIAAPGPQLCEVVMDPLQSFAPKVAGMKLPDGRMVSNPLEDMHPLLDRAELAANMIVPQYRSGEESGQ